MRTPITEEQRRLCEIVEPYSKNGVLREDAPEYVKEAKKELLRIAKEEDELFFSLL